jgi:predicted ATPase
MPSRIARLYINNYRCFVNFELRLERRSLLLGYNGSGKSSVFDVLDGIKRLVRSNLDAKDLFPTNTLSEFTTSNEQRFELDIETERGLLRYVLVLAHDLEERTAAIISEELSLDDKPAYRFTLGEVQLYSENNGPDRGPFPFSPQRSFLASLDPKAPLSPVTRFKTFVGYCSVVGLNPVHIGALAPTEGNVLDRDGANFASYCRSLLQERPDSMQRANEALREVLPGFHQLHMEPAGRAKMLVATFRLPGGSPYGLDFNALSDGQKALIVLYVLLYGPMSRQAVLCLDEPDNFVSIREIQPFLVELEKISDDTGLQVLFISHSPEVIDYIGAESAILLERPDGGHTRVGSLDTAGPLRLSELMARGWHAEP